MNRLKLLVGILLVTVVAYAGTTIYQGGVAIQQGIYSFQRFVLSRSTIANLPSSPQTGEILIVTDGKSATDCTVGGGTIRALCEYTGTVWQSRGGGNTVIRKVLNETISANDTVLQNDDELFFDVAPGEYVLVTVLIGYVTSEVADIKVDFTATPACNTGFDWGFFGLAVGSTGGIGDVKYHMSANVAGAQGYGGAGSTIAPALNGIAVCNNTGGASTIRVQFRFAKNTAEASATTVAEGSRIQIFRFKN